MSCKNLVKAVSAVISILIIILLIGCKTTSESKHKSKQGKWISKRVITFTPIVGGVGLINEDGTNEHYLQLPEKKDRRWSGLGPIFPDKMHCLLTSYDNYSIVANVTGKMFNRLWKYNLSTGELTELITKERPADQVFCAALISDGQHMLCSVSTENHKNQVLYLTDMDGKEWKLISGQEFIYGIEVNHSETRIAFHIASEGYTINTTNMEGNDRKHVAGKEGHLFFGPEWSPNDQWLAYLDCDTKKEPSHHYADLCIGRPDGSEHRIVTVGQSQYFGTAYGAKEHRGGGSNTTSWTPDGKYLIYSKLSPGAHHDAAYKPELGNHLENVFSPESAKGGCSINLLDPFSGKEIPVTQYQEDKWDFRGVVSPDGKSLVYTSAKVAGRGEIYLCHIDGTENKFLTAGKDGLGADFSRWLDVIVKEDSQLAK